MKLSFMTKPGFGGGKLLEGGRVCRKHFKIIVKSNIDFGSLIELNNSKAIPVNRCEQGLMVGKLGN